MAGTLARPLQLLLVVSLALNLFVLGAVAADTVIGGGRVADMLWLSQQRPRFFGMPSPREIRDLLAESRRPLLDGIYELHRPQFRERLQGMFEARQAVAEAIAAEPFDRQRLEAAFATLRERSGAMAMAAQDTMIELASQLNAAERVRLAEMLSKRHGRPQ